MFHVFILLHHVFIPMIDFHKQLFNLYWLLFGSDFPMHIDLFQFFRNKFRVYGYW